MYGWSTSNRADKHKPVKASEVLVVHNSQQSGGAMSQHFFELKAVLSPVAHPNVQHHSAMIHPSLSFHCMSVGCWKMIPTSKDFSTSSGLKAGEKHAAQGIKSVGNGSTGTFLEPRISWILTEIIPPYPLLEGPWISRHRKNTFVFSIIEGQQLATGFLDNENTKVQSSEASCVASWSSRGSVEKSNLSTATSPHNSQLLYTSLSQ